MSRGQLLRVTTGSANGGPEHVAHYIVAEDDLEKAMAILRPAVPASARIESAGEVVESLLRTLELAPGQFTEV
jgi:hypothetical protein